jgi:CheY-like chemotaxis protein
VSEKKRILFIDDDEDFLTAQKAFFTSRGFEVTVCNSTEEALKSLSQMVPDIIFMDLMMENYDSGFRLSHRIRGDERLRDIPIVMLSGVVAVSGKRFDLAKEGLKDWCRLDGFIDKPVTGKQLLDMIEKFTGGSPGGEH